MSNPYSDGVGRVVKPITDEDCFQYEILDERDQPFRGGEGLQRVVIHVRIAVDPKDPKSQQKILGHLNSGGFRAKFEGFKESLGLQNYGIDNGRFWPDIKEVDGNPVCVAYIREVKLTKNV
jgi:hypothetical protein